MSTEAVQETPEEAERRKNAEYQSAYYLKNKERLKAAARAYRKSHRKECAERDRKYARDNASKIEVQQKEYYRRNRARLLVRMAEYRAEHREALRQYHRDNSEHNRARCAKYRVKFRNEVREMTRRWRKMHPEEVRHAYQARRALKKKARVGPKGVIIAWERSWRNSPAVTCHWCGSIQPGREMHADHVRPLSRGGAHSVDNLVPACSKCNQRKHAKLPEVWMAELKERGLGDRSSRIIVVSELDTPHECPTNLPLTLPEATASQPQLMAA